MATNSQESELIIRARDLSSEPIAKIAETVTKLAAALGIQTDAANKGEGSMKGLSLAVSDLDRVLAAVLNQSSKLDAFEKSIARVADATSGYAKAKADLDAFKASMEGVEKPTADQAATLVKLQAAVTAAGRESRAAEAQFTRQSAAMAKLGVDTANLTAAQATNAASLQTVSNAIRNATTAQVNYGEVRSKARADAAAQTKAENDAAAALKKIADEEIAQQRALDKAKQDSAAIADKVAKQLLDIEKQQQDALRVQAAEQAELNRLRKAAQDTLSGTAPSGLGASPEAVQQINSASSALAGILAPAAQARATLAGVEAEVTSVGKALEGTDKKSKDYLRTLQDTTEQSKRALTAQAQLVDSYRNQERATLSAGEAANTAYAAVEKLDKELAAASAPSRELSTALTKAKNDLASATAEYEKQNLSLTKLRQALEAAGIDYTKLDVTSARLNASAVNLTKTVKQLDEALAAGEKAHGGSVSFFGIRPDQISNIEHEVSHAFDAIAAGASPFRALLEQLGKLLFNFQGALQRVTPYLGYMALAALPLIAALGTLSRALQDAGSSRDFENRLRVMNETTLATGKSLTETAREIAHFGVAFQDARKGVDEFLKAGLNPAYFTVLGEAADKLSVSFGITFQEASKKLAEGLTTGVEGVSNLNKEFGLFTPAQAELIRHTYELGETNKAMALTLDAVKEAAARAGAEARGPASQAMIGLKNAYSDLTAAIANNRVIAGLIAQLGDLARAVTVLINLGGGGGTGTGYTQRILDANDAAIKKQKDGLEEINRLRNSPENAGGVHNAELDKEAKDRQKAIDELTDTNNKLREKAGLQAKGTEGAAQENQQLRANNQAQQVSRDLYVAEREEERLARSDRKLKGEEARKYDEERNANFQKLLVLRAQARGLDTEDPKVKESIQRDAADAARRLQEVRTRQNQQDEAEQRALALRTAEANAAGLKGAQRLAAEKTVINLKVEQETTRLAEKEGISREEAANKFAADIAAFRTAEEGKAQRAADKGRQAGADKALNAEESITKRLLALKERLDGQDKTDVEAQKRRIEEKYEKEELLIQQARRKGAGTAGTINLDEVEAELAAAKKKEIENTVLASQEAALNALLTERKTAYAAVTDAVKTGSISAAEGFNRINQISAQLSPKIQELAKKALEFAKNLGGADPTPKVAAAIAMFQKQVQGVTEKEDAGPLVAVEAALGRINNLAKQRKDIEVAYQALQKDGLVSSTTADQKIEEAYKRTSPEIQKIIDETKTQLDQMKQLGQITPETYDLMIAKLTEYTAQAQYASAAQKELIKGIESSVETRAVSAFTNIATAIGKVVAGQGKFKDILSATAQAFASFAAGVLEDIAKIILKQTALAAISAVVAYLTGGASTAGGASAVASATSAGSAVSSIGSSFSAGGLTSSSVSHEGGVVGRGNGMSRTLSADAFTNAPRFHTGSIVGLNSDEQTAILQKGEEVLSKDNPRNILNASSGGSNIQQQRPLRNVLVMDQKDLAGAMAGAHGEDMVLTHIRNNTAAVRTMIS